MNDKYDKNSYDGNGNGTGNTNSYDGNGNGTGYIKPYVEQLFDELSFLQRELQLARVFATDRLEFNRYGQYTQHWVIPPVATKNLVAIHVKIATRHDQLTIKIKEGCFLEDVKVRLQGWNEYITHLRQNVELLFDKIKLEFNEE